MMTMTWHPEAFYGPARLVSRAKVHMDRSVVYAFAAAGAVGAVLFAAWLFRPSPLLRSLFASAYELGATAFCGWWLWVIARSQRVECRDVMVAADARGLSLDGALVAPREALRVATLRLGTEASTHVASYGTLRLAARPNTVEIATHDRAWNLDVGDLDRAAALLRALGAAPTTIPATHPYPPGSALA